MRSKFYSALSLLHGFFWKKYSRNLRVLAYHKVPEKEAFEKQVLYLIKKYNIISISQLLEHLRSGKALPENSLLITFDDGDISVLQNGLPILKKYDLSSCLFIITSLINTSEDVWIKTVEIQEMKNGKSYLEARRKISRMKRLANRDRLKEMKKYGYINQQQLKTADLRDMITNKMFVGNHTHTHPMLDMCDLEEIKEEMFLSKKVFEELELEGYNIFAYPNGNNSDQTENVLRDCGIELAFLFDHKVNERVINPLRISRIMVDADTKMREFKTKVSGVHPYFFHLNKV